MVGHLVADELAGAVKDSDGIYFVPAFSGLMSPHWREDARGSDLALPATLACLMPPLPVLS